MTYRIRWIVAGLIAVFCAAATPLMAADKITVFAAASLKESLDEVAANFSREKNTPQVVISYAASSALAKQIEQAAPADMFISADEDWMNYLDTRGLIIKESRSDLLGNKLVLVVPASLTIDGMPSLEMALKDLPQGGLAMADPDSVPAGKYGKAALTYLKAWDGVAAKVIRAENVRAALAIVARGETKYGIVYATDAAAEPKVKQLHEFPAASYPKIIYPVAATKTAVPETTRFLSYLKSPAAQKIFAQRGFTYLIAR
jgi:molybdate transport system substrate-binding protein